MNNMTKKFAKTVVLGSAAAVVLSGCSFSPYALPLPGGADVGSDPYSVTVQFRDVLDLVPQSAVRVNDVAVGRVTSIKLDGWTAVVKLKINSDATLPDNAEATIRQTSLLGEKFVSLNAPASGAEGRLNNGDVIPLSRSGRNPEIEEVLGAASLLFNGGGLEKTQTVVRELNKTLDGNEPEIRELLSNANVFVSQLDANKAAIITSLEKVNNLAVQTNRQKAAITGALDNLPAALTVVNQQRDDLVTLLKALNRLGDVGTKVVKDSKNDTIADLKALGPVLKQLANSGDDLPKNLTTLLTFPFIDKSIDGPTYKGAKDFQEGDYFNLAIEGLDLSALVNIPGILTPPSARGGAGATTPGSALPSAPDLSALTDLVGGLVQGSSAGSLPGITVPNFKAPSAAATKAPPSSRPTSKPQETSGSELPQLCSLLGSCRVAPSSYSPAESSDLARLMMEPVVTK